MKQNRRILTRVKDNAKASSRLTSRNSLKSHILAENDSCTSLIVSTITFYPSYFNVSLSAVSTMRTVPNGHDTIAQERFC